MDTIFSERLQTERNPLLLVKIEVEQATPNGINMNLIIGADTYFIQYTIDLVKDQFSINGLELVATKVSCIVWCGIALAGPIYDCYRKNKKNWKGFLDCLKDQKATVGASLLACLGPCFS